MENKLQAAFHKIHAEDALKEKTAEFLSGEIQKRKGAHKPSRMRLAITLASFAMLLIIGGFSNKLYFTPSAYVDMDVNPSIELIVNRFGRVIEAHPYNDDGAVILQDVSVVHTPYTEAAEKLLDAMIDKGYLKQDGLVSVTVQAGSGALEQELQESIQTAVFASLTSHHSDAEADIFAVSAEVWQNAHEHKMSPAKYLAIIQLQQVDPTATFEGCADHSIGEIRQFTREHGGHHGEQPAAENSCDKDGHSGWQNTPSGPKQHNGDVHGNQNQSGPQVLDDHTSIPGQHHMREKSYSSSP